MRPPRNSTALNDLFASLPALQAACLYFCDPEDWTYADEGSNAALVWEAPHKRTQPDDFPVTLLR